MITPKVHITLPENFDEDENDEARHFAPIIPLLKGVIEVNVWHIRRALRRAQKGLGYPIPPLYASGVRYKEDPPGQENWKDCLAVLADGHGDCLPLSTLVVRQVGDDKSLNNIAGELVPMLALRIGDRVMGDGSWTPVREVCVTGGKRILALYLNNGCQLRCSSEHKLFRLKEGGASEEIRAGEVRVGNSLMSPSTLVVALVGDWQPPEYTLNLRPETSPAVLRAVANTRRINRSAAPRVERVVEEGSELCMDITTGSGKFWLPESDVLVHNCDRLVAWRVAELLAAGYPAEPIIKWKQIPKDVMVGLGHPPHMVPPEGIHMVHVCVGLPGWQRYAHLYEENPLVEDPSKLLGMGGQYASGV
jgi:hypothetical protein